MPDLPISGLPAATTPLSGVELVAVVQIGTTCQTPVSSFSLIGPVGPPGPPGPGIDTGMSYAFTAPQSVAANSFQVDFCDPTDALHVPIGGMTIDNGTVKVTDPNGGFIQLGYSPGGPLLTGQIIGANFAGSLALSVVSGDGAYQAGFAYQGYQAALFAGVGGEVACCTTSDAIQVFIGTCAFGVIRTGTWNGDPIVPSYGGSYPTVTADLAGQTAGVPSVVTATAPNDGEPHQYRIGCYVNTLTGATVTVFVSFTDETNTPQVVSIEPAGGVNPFQIFPETTILCFPNTAITLTTNVIGAIPYDVGGSITQVN